MLHQVNSGGLENDPKFSPVKRKNDHPTLKGIELMRWLIRLICPKGGIVLDPFCGSGSTGCAAVLESCSFVGLEQDAHYVEIAKARIAHWEIWARELRGDN